MMLNIYPLAKISASLKKPVKAFTLSNLKMDPTTDSAIS